MKKLLALVFAFVMLCSVAFAFSAFADDEVTEPTEPDTNIADEATVTTNNSHWQVVGASWCPNCIPYLYDGDPLTGIPSCAKSGTNVQTFTFAEKQFVEKVVLLVNGYGKRGNIDTIPEDAPVNINANYTVKAYDVDGKQIYSKMLSSKDQTELVYDFDEPLYITKVTVEYASGYDWQKAYLREVEIHEKLVVSECDEHVTERVVTVEPGCTTEGEYSMVCTVCSAVISTKEIPATGHIMGDDYRVKTPATCISAPVVEYNCTACGSLEERDAHVDDVTDYIDLAAVKTDGAGGWTTSYMAMFDNNMDSYLMASGNWFVQTETVLDRNYYISSATIWAATNSDSSWLILYYKAPGSDEWIEAGKVHVPDDAVASSYTLELDEPVYASAIKVFVGGPDGKGHGGGPGVASYSGCVYEVKVTGSLVADTAAGHTWEVGETVAPTCTVQGYTKYTCTVCAAENTGDYVKWTGHTWVNADCVTPKTCSVCAATEGEALGHSYFYECDKVCQVCFVESRPEAVHTIVHVDAVAPTCTTNGNVEYWNCSICGYAWLDEACTQVTNQMSVVVPAAHSYFYNCDKVCQVCFEETNPDATHTIVYVEAVAATCTENGNEEYWYCSDCGYAWLDEACTLVANQRSVIIPATGHEWDEGYFMSWPYPSCQNPFGTKTYTCNVCWETYDEENVEVDLTDVQWHNAELDWETAVDANCQTAGYEKYTCSDCGKVFEINTPADTENGHAWVVDESVSYDATCAKDGYSKQTCSICNTTRELVLEKEFYGQHEYGYDPETYVEATCQQDGYAHYTCEVCGDSYVETPSAGAWLHNWVNSSNGLIQTCATCGEVSFGNAELTGVENGFTAMFAWEGTALNIWNNEFDVYYSFEVISSENGVYVLVLNTDDDSFGFNGATAVLTTVSDGGTLVVTTVDETATYTFENKAPDYNSMLNGTYAYYAISGELMAAFKFEDGIITVLVDNMGMGFPESFSYTYDPIEGTISTPEVPYANFSVYDGVIYFGRGFMLVEYDPTPAEPEEPVNYGDVIDSMDVTTTDSYGYIDLYSYTANKAGQYSFYIPAGLGFYSVAQYDVYGNAEIDFYDNANGYYVVVDLAAGETIEFYIGSTIKADWTIDVYFYTTEVHTHTEEIIPVVPSYKENGVFYAGFTSGIKCAECDEILVAPVENSVDFQFKAISLSLSDYINIVYKAQVPAGYTNVYAVFTMNGNDIAVVEYTIDSSNGRYCFTFEGVKTQLLCDNVSATVYATTADGLTTAYNYPTYSIKTYCSNQLNKTTVKAAEKVMLSNLLVVGAKAQKFANYNTSVLATDGLEGIMCADTYTTIPTSENMQTVSGDKSTIADWKTASLVVDNAMAIKLKVYVAPENLETVSFKVVMDRSDIGFANNYYTFTYEDFTPVEGEANYYTFLVDEIRVVEYGSKLTCTIYNGEEQIGRTFTYSVNTYIQKNQGGSNPSKEQEFTRALYLYGKSARAFLGK